MKTFRVTWDEVRIAEFESRLVLRRAFPKTAFHESESIVWDAVSSLGTKTSTPSSSSPQEGHGGCDSVNGVERASKRKNTT